MDAWEGQSAHIPDLIVGRWRGAVVFAADSSTPGKPPHGAETESGWVGRMMIL
jgi:hypothetical protein